MKLGVGWQWFSAGAYQNYDYGRNISVLFVFVVLLFSSQGLAKSSHGNAPSTRQSYFDNTISKLYYFENPAMVLALDRESGSVLHSSDHGTSWSKVEEIPTGAAGKLYGHPFEPKTAFALSPGTEHWVTWDEGKTWKPFSTPLNPTSSGERPLKFHADRTGWILYTGERCKEERSGWWPFPRMICHDEVFYTRDAFKEATVEYKAGDRAGSALDSLLGEDIPVTTCIWAHQTKEFEEMAENAIFCLEIVASDKADKLRKRSSEWKQTPSGTTSPSRAEKHHMRDLVNHKKERYDKETTHSRSYSTNRTLSTRGIVDEAVSAMDAQTSRYTVRLVASEDFFDTKRIVHFGNGNDGHSGDKAGGGVIGISVIKRYILAAISHAHSEETDLFISMDGRTWAESHLPLPPGSEEDAYTVLESTEHSVFVDVITSRSGAAGTLFRSNSNGTYYTQSLEHTHRSRDGMVDVERVQGIEGVLIANQVSNWDQLSKGSIFHRDSMQLRSRISFDDGAHWRFLRAPDKDMDGKKYSCSEDGWKTGECALHVHSVTSFKLPGHIFGSPSSSGVLLAVGSVGTRLLKWHECDTFLSRDGGITWKMVHRDAHYIQVADSGSVLVIVNGEEPTDVIEYSLDGGDSWQRTPLESKTRVKALLVDNNGLSPVVLAVGTVHSGGHKNKHTIFAADFTKAWDRQCNVDPKDPTPNKDIESWALIAHQDNDCVMGHRSEYVRRKPDAQCYMGLKQVLIPRKQDCDCSEEDFECDYNFSLNDRGKCELVGDLVVPHGECLQSGDHFMASSGYRQIAGDTCNRDRGKVMDTPVDRPCPSVRSPGGSNGNNGHGDGTKYGPVSHHTTVIPGEMRMFAFQNTSTYLLLSTSSDLYRSSNDGGTWDKIDIAKSTGKPRIGKPLFIVMHAYDNKRAFLYMDNDHIVFTVDRGETWKVFKSLPSPVNTLNVRPILDFNPVNPDWLLYIGGTQCPGCHTEAWASNDNGDTWNRITTHVQRCLFARANEFEALPPEAIVCTGYHLTNGKENEQDRQRGHHNSNNYVELKVFNSPFDKSEFKTIRFGDPEHSQVLDFYVYSKYIVAAVIEKNPDDAGQVREELSLYVSDNGLDAHKARFPPGINLKPEGITLLPTHAGTVLVDVEGAPNTGDPDSSTGWGMMFASNSNGTHFHLVLEHTNRNNRGLVDIDRVDGMNGMLIANRVLNIEALGKPGVRRQVKTVASWDDGRTWHSLEAPEKDSQGRDIDCLDCSLNLYGRANLIGYGPLYGSLTAPGYLVGIGMVGPHLGNYGNSRTYLSSDGGRTWKEVRQAESLFEFGDHGSLIMLVDGEKPTDELLYSYDSGESWRSYKFTDKGMKVLIDDVNNGFTNGQSVMLIAREVSPDGRVRIGETLVVNIDFSKVFDHQCRLDTRDHEKSDFELWTPSLDTDSRGRKEPLCILGTETSYWRRKSDAMCWVGNQFSLPDTQNRTCECTISDYECDEGFWLNGNGECVLDGADPYQPADCHEGTVYMGRSGYRKISMSACSGGVDFEKPTERICGRSGGIHASAYEFDSGIADIQYFRNSHHVIVQTETRKLMVSYDEGSKWVDLPVPAAHTSKNPTPEKFSTIISHPYFEDYAYFLPSTGIVGLYTDDEARTTRRIHFPSTPARAPYHPALRFHPDRPDWLIFLGQPDPECSPETDPMCHVEAFISEDHGAHWDALIAPVGSGGCTFLRTDRIHKGRSKSVVCARHFTARENPGSVVISDNWFKKDEHTLVKNATDFAFIGKYLLISKDQESGKALSMHISLDGENIAIARFPGNLEKVDPAYTVLEPPEGFEYRDEKGIKQKMPGAGLMMHVTKSTKSGAEWGTIYSSNSNGTYFRQSLEYVNRDGMGLVDFERIRALEGVALANIVSNPEEVANKGKPKQLRTMLTVDGGSRWHYLAVEKGSNSPCRQAIPPKGDCALHLHGYTEVSDPENIYSSSGAVGLIIGVGNIGSSLDRIGTADTYLSRDGGATWKLTHKGPMWHEFGDHGSIIVAANRLHPVTQIEYSLDQGASWNGLELPKKAHGMRVEMLTTTPDSTSRQFILYGKKDNAAGGVIVGLNFAGAQPRVCKFDPMDDLNNKNLDDFELFSPKPLDSHDSNNCILGREVKYYRRIANKECYVGDEFRSVRFLSNTCDCTRRDYECNYNFVLDPGNENDPYGECVLIKGMRAPRTNCTEGEKDYFTIEAPYRKIPQSVCRGDLPIAAPKEVWCPGKARSVAIFWSLVLPIVFLGLAYIGYKAWRDKYPYLRLEDIGPRIRDFRNHPGGPNSGLIKQVEPVFLGAVSTVRALGGAAREGVLWTLDRAAPYLPSAVQRWSYEHPPRWGSSLTMDGRSRHELRSGGGGSRFSYRPLGTNEAASRVFGTYEEAHGDELENGMHGFDVYDETEAGFNHFLEEEQENMDVHGVGVGEADARIVDRQVLFASTEFSDEESDIDEDMVGNGQAIDREPETQ